MDKRLELHEKLCELLGSRNVYFQPPSNLKMNYPCIRYSRNRVDKKQANDQVYKSNIGYQIIIIDEDPDSEIVDKMINFPKTSYTRHYVSDNLNHDVFLTYY